MFGDIFNIKSRVKSIDKRFDIKYEGKGQYTVTQNGAYFMAVPHKDLHGGLINRIKEIVWKNEHTDLLTEIEKKNAKIDASKEREQENLAEAMAKDIRPYVNRIY